MTLPPEVVNAIQTSSFISIPFGWEYAGPQKERRDALDHYTGTVWFASHANFNAMYALQRAVAVTPITPLGPVYVDWWGTDPSGPLVVSFFESHRAILVEMKGVRWVAYGSGYGTSAASPPEIHQATVDFLLLD